MLTTNYRLIRELATVKAVHATVIQFPTHPELPMPAHLVKENINLVQTPLEWALEPNLNEEELNQWDVLVAAVAQTEMPAMPSDKE